MTPKQNMNAPICAGTFGTYPKAEYDAIRGKICSIEIGDEVAEFVKASPCGGYKAFDLGTGWEIGDFQSYEDAFKASLAGYSE